MVIFNNISGMVTQKTENHVGCLVYQTFHVSIPNPMDNSDKTWLGYDAAPTNMVEFKITFVDLNGRLPYIKGELL